MPSVMIVDDEPEIIDLTREILGGEGYTVIGGKLSLAQRDVRVYDNFTMATANNNTTPDSNWPGYTGAEMAIWKGCAEWASELHGGNGCMLEFRIEKLFRDAAIFLHMDATADISRFKIVKSMFPRA